MVRSITNAMAVLMNNYLFFIQGIVILVMVMVLIYFVYLYRKSEKRNKELSRTISEQADELKGVIDEKQEVIDAVVQQRETLKNTISDIKSMVFQIVDAETIVSEVRKYYNGEVVKHFYRKNN